MRMKPSEEAIEFARIFRSNGYELYLVGGAVRDWMLGKPNHDYDFTTSAEPAEVKAMFRRTIDTGIRHGTVTVLFKGQQFEVTTFRADGDYKDSRHPESVSFVKNLDEDLKRRDFTINALAAELPEGRIIDLNDGKGDLRKKLIRAIGEPEKRFEEDALRMLRACRFSAQLGFRIEEKTEEAMRKLAHTVTNVSAERIREELFRIIASDNPRNGFEAMRRTGLLSLILPEVDACYGFEQGGMHSEDLYEHLIRALEACVTYSYPMSVRLAAIFHDIGKVKTRKADDERGWTFYQHECASADMADEIFRRLKCSNDERETTAHLIRNHMFSYTPDWSPAAVRRFIKRVGIDYINPLFELRIADAAATGNGNVDLTVIETLSEKINAELEKANALSIRDLAVNGTDLIAAGIKPGPAIGRILAQLLDEVIENPSLNTKDYLENRALTLSQSQEQ